MLQKPPFGRNTRLHCAVHVSFLLPTETHRCDVLQKLAFCCFPPQAQSILLQCSASIWNLTDLSAVPLQILNWMHSTTAIFHFYEKRPLWHEKRPYSCTRRSIDCTHPIHYASEPLERPLISMKQDLTADYREGGKKSWDHFLKNFHEPDFCTWDLRLIPDNNMVLITISKKILVRTKIFKNNLRIFCHPICNQLYLNKPRIKLYEKRSICMRRDLFVWEEIKWMHSTKLSRYSETLKRQIISMRRDVTYMRRECIYISRDQTKALN